MRTAIKEQEFVFPTKPHKAEVNAKTMILFGKEKCGKTTALTSLKNYLIIDTEAGTNLVDAVAIKAPEDRGPVGKMQWLKKVGEALKERDERYDYVIIDTLTEVNEWAEWSGTWRYMNSAQGKKFNREKDDKGQPISGGPFIDPGSDDYESVHTLADGNGYRWSRNEVMDVFHLFNGTANKCVIYVCHVEDKYLGLKEETTQLPPKQLALTGKLREMLPRKVDVIGHVYNDKGELKVNFKGSEEKLGGGRAKHLLTYNGTLDWSKIFI